MTRKKNNKVKTKKQLQVGENIKRLIAKEINRYINAYKEDDFLTIIKAEISKDLRYCKVFYRCKVYNKDYFEEELSHITNELSNLVYKFFKMRVRPEIRFIFDNTMIIIENIEKLEKRFNH
jgi:ribosome-binding factor A